ncbi:hypothetical protein C7974DRAFT_372713 [Boeremia exigua]|uniref:uncharacterized protein n=1 Tax=Boeremia exigua TaxID=749465 RepID=UPI001E8E29AD|nr:uncharacterized protein C7974DRAFT_372713 [Boeremia exigua]KAH6642851.1 hypothetical protein C7974DRAFT_372713 [Boeremia exigua]
MDPLSAGVFASIGSAFKFADVAVRVAEVGSENAVFVRAICVVRSDLEEVERLLSLGSIQTKLKGTPGKVPWVKNAIQNTRCALNEIGKWVERARVEQETTGSIKFETRIRWVFNDHEKLLNRKTELTTCHQQLSNVLGYLAGLEDIPMNPPLLGLEDSTHFDDILARHNRLSRPTASRTSLKTIPKVQHEALAHVNKARPESNSLDRPPNVWNSPKQVPTTAYEQHGFEQSPSISSSLSPPCSPPPAYTTAVSLDPVRHDVHSGSYPWNTIEKDVAATRSVGKRDTLDTSYDNIWACKSDPVSMTVPELAGDTIVFSATNSAGPVNPYELCASTVKPTSGGSRAAQRPHENLAEMLGDLHFRAELPNNVINPPPRHSPRSRAEFEPVEAVQSKRRTTSETPPRVHRRPLPASALSDSLLTVHELPSVLTTHHKMPPSSYQDSRAAIKDSYDSELFLWNPHQPHIKQRPVSSIAMQSHEKKAASVSDLSRYSAPPPMASARNEYATASSADSTTSRGLHTKPEVPRAFSAPSTQDPTTYTRMQSQKRIMDLLSSIDT